MSLQLAVGPGGTCGISLLFYMAASCEASSAPRLFSFLHSFFLLRNHVLIIEGEEGREKESHRGKSGTVISCLPAVD